jgi:hypothetical protein
MVVPKVKLCNIPMQMLLGTVLVDAFHAPLEHTVEALNGIGVNFATAPLELTVTDVTMAGKVLAKALVLSGFVGHDLSARVHVRLDDG